MLRALLLAGAVPAMLGARAQDLVAAEYWVDADPGWGQGTAIAGLSQPDVPGLQFQVPSGGLGTGLHVIGIRTKDANGRWSLSNLIPIFVAPAPQPADIMRTEYFWNTDDGWGSGTDAGIDGTPQAGGQATASTAGILPGMNTLFCRSLDAIGHWSLTNALPVYVDEPDVNAPIVHTEYFLNTDPGWGGGLDAAVDGAAEVPVTVIAADMADAGPGMNTIFFRSKDAHGHWSLTNPVPLHAEHAPTGEVVAAESFWDEDPGFGQGDPVPGWTSGADVSGQFGVEVPMIGWGWHKLYLRTKDSHGHWSLTNWQLDMDGDPDSILVEGTVDADALAAQNGISVSPNPFTEGITVRTDDGQSLRVVVYDPQGRLVHDQALTGGAFIDLSRHASGAYTAFFWKGGGRIQRVKLVKR